jgi:hypothetical protein
MIRFLHGIIGAGSSAVLAISLYTGGLGSEVTPIPRLQCPIGTCVIGGYRFGDDWHFRRCPVNGPWKKHTGADLKAGPGTEVVAAEAGIVKLVYSAGTGWASAILIEHVNGNSRYVTQYMHVNPKLTVKIGQSVKRGEPIAIVAAITEPHLHFGIWAGPYGPVADQRGALPSCTPPTTSCYDGERTDPGFPQSWINPMPFLDDAKGSPRGVVSTSLQLSPPKGSYLVGEPISGSFTITNRGNASLNMRQVLIGGRVGDTCPNSDCPDFQPIPGNVTLGPGKSYKYSGSITPRVKGNYSFYAAYEKPDGKWEIPVESENGTINKLAIVVQDVGIALTSSNPASLYASPNKQTLVLFGKGLSKTLYCRVRSSNGMMSNIYIPLKQLVSGVDDRLQLNTVFRMRGTYYITAFTLGDHSNEFPIQVK